VNKETELRQIAEGKTKIVRPCPSNHLHVLIESKDVITAGDGAKRDILPGKGAAATATTCDIFRLIGKDGVVPTHFHEQRNETTFEAIRATMIPIEVVVRRIATGSYLKRNPGTEEGVRFPSLVVEMFHKDDKAHDPIMIKREGVGSFTLHDAKQPISEVSKLGEVAGDSLTKFGLGDNDITLMRVAAAYVFSLLEKAWLKQGIALVDLKVEFGFDWVGRLMLADVIDNDSWRIWPHGQKSGMLDKQVYRDLVDDDPERRQKAMEKIGANYELVAKLTSRFFQ
jgi:phosphoribosylaminoimidazole-succinocarboxamide synthase